MVEIERSEIPSRGAVGAALGTGIAGLALGVLNGGIPNVLGGWGNCGNAACSENMMVNRYELNMQRDLTNKDMEIAYLRGRDAAKSDSLELYKYVDGRFTAIEQEISNQRVYNATNTAAMNCMSGQIAQLYSLTKLVVPNGSVCPGWGDVTVAVTPTTTAGA